MDIKRHFPKAMLFLLVLLVGAMVGGITIALASSTSPFARNASGQTYGSLLDVSVPGTEPDLVKAMGVDGKTVGYVRYSDLNGPESENVTKRIPLYKVDGKTVIGEFEMGPGDSTIRIMDSVTAK